MMPEAQLKKDLKKYLGGRNIFWTAIKGGAHAKAGDPDMVVCYRGRFIGVEAKTYEGTQSDWQKLRERQIIESGGIYRIIRSVDDLIQVLDEVDESIDGGENLF